MNVAIVLAGDCRPFFPRHDVDCANRGAVAAFAGGIWQVDIAFRRYCRWGTMGVFEPMLETLVGMVERDGRADVIDSRVARSLSS